MRSVSSQCNTRLKLRLLHLLYDIMVMWQKTIKHASLFKTLIKHGFLTNQSARRVPSIERLSMTFAANGNGKNETFAVRPQLSVQ